MTSTTGVMWTRKSVNVRSARLAMMMFGGSPTSVAAPPMLDANASASRNGTGADTQLPAHRERHRRDQQHRGHVVQQGRGAGRHQDQQDQESAGPPPGQLRRVDRQVLERAGPPHYPDDQHHPEQQEDDIPVDAGLPGVERLLGVDDPEREDQRSPPERGSHPVDPLGGDQDVHADEDRHRQPPRRAQPRRFHRRPRSCDQGHRHGPTLRRSPGGLMAQARRKDLGRRTAVLPREFRGASGQRRHRAGLDARHCGCDRIGR